MKSILILLIILSCNFAHANEIDTAKQQILNEEIEGVSVEIVEIPQFSEEDKLNIKKALEELKGVK